MTWDEWVGLIFLALGVIIVAVFVYLLVTYGVPICHHCNGPVYTDALG